jgi:predicted GNAT family acetyltransferase
MSHPLDRPIWASLTTRQATLAKGGPHAFRFDPDYAMFAAVADDTEASMAGLADLVRSYGETALVEAQPLCAPAGLTVVSQAICHQMIARRPVPPGRLDFEVVDLTEADAPQMYDLATLTRPGPYFRRTHQLGDFVGVKADGRLIAMAGERLKPDGFTEVSGVCTHPEARGRGYAGALMRIVAARIVARGDTPFLHVYATNRGAIALYETLGFELRQPLTMTVLSAA